MAWCLLALGFLFLPQCSTPLFLATRDYATGFMQAAKVAVRLHNIVSAGPSRQTLGTHAFMFLSLVMYNTPHYYISAMASDAGVRNKELEVLRLATMLLSS